jgi:glycine cleavage system H protein
MYTNDMKFLTSHEWVRPEQDGTACIGITEHAQELLGDLVYIELPKIGQKINAKSTIGVVESVKAASDLYSPVSGEIIEINNNAVNDPTIINNSPHSEGWLIKVKLNDISELNNLMNLDEYRKMIG